LAACASDTKKPSPVHTEVGQVTDTLRHLTQAYAEKKTDRFLEQLSPASKLRESLEQQIPKSFARFSEVTLSIVIERIEIKEKQLLTAVRWKGTWKKDAASRFEKRGHALFIWAPRKEPKLLKIKGRSPFSISLN